MRHSAVEQYCLSLPCTELVVQWGESRVYKVGGKIFAILSPIGERPATIAFKASDESFYILTQEPGIRPAPYLAKSHWVALDSLEVLPTKDLKAYLSRAHQLIAGGLSKKKRQALGLEANP